MFDAFIFDLDWTLIEFDEDIKKKELYLWLHNFAENEKQAEKLALTKDREERIKLLGITEKEYVNKLLPSLADIDLKLRKKFLFENKMRLRKGVIDLLKFINTPKALVSQASKESVSFTLNYLNMNNFFDFIHYRDYSAGYRKELKKPDKKLAFKACKAMNVKPSKRIAVVGDSKNDIEFAKNAGFTSISVFKKNKEEDYYFKNLLELKDWLAE